MGQGRRQEELPAITNANKVSKEIHKLTNMDELKAEDLVRMAESLAKDLARYINTTQIRRFLDEFNRIRSESLLQKGAYNFREKCMFLKPKLAYAAARQHGESRDRGRQKSRAIKDLMDVLNPCVDRVHNDKDFNKFYRFFESIVAYHRYYGGD